MSRYLFVVPPFAGHVNPAIGVADELAGRGHAVSWVGDKRVLDALLPTGTVIHECASPVSDRPADVRGFAALKFLWEEVLIPLAESMVPAVEDAVAKDQPDVLVVDQQAFAGSVVAERIGIPWVTSATTSAELADPLAALPKARDWVIELLARLRRRYGDPGKEGDLRFSPHLVLGFTTRALIGEQRAGGGKVCFVGPVWRRQAAGLASPLARLDAAKPLVYISLGTVNADVSERFLHECVEALRSRPWLQAVVADPGCVITDAPEHVVVREAVPQLAVLERCSAVVCHAGHNTVCEALGNGVPLVVAPIRDDQTIVADQVVRAGAGVRLRFARARATHIGRAIDDVLHQPGYLRAACEVRDSFRAAGGARAAADQLEAVAAPA
ncbi:MAG: glycosyltransferase [Haloechinothrix sp.]